MKTNGKKYYPLIGTYLDNLKGKEVYFSRTALIEFINRNIPLIEQVKIDLFFDDVIKDYYQNFASNSQKELLSNFMVKTLVDNQLIIDERSVDLMPMSLDIEFIEEQNIEISQKFEELIEKTPSLSIQIFNNVVEELNTKISSIKEEYVISVTGSSKVEAIYKNAEDVYNSYLELINTYEAMKYEVQRLFNDFSELRDNLKYFREDFFYIVKIYGVSSIQKNEIIKLFDFAEVRWLEYAEIKSNLDLGFLKIKEHCSTFYKFVEENLEDNVGNIFNKHFDQISNKIGKKSYNANKLKTDLITGGAEIAYGVIKGVIDSRAESKVVVENLKKEIEYLKLSFTEDKSKLQSDIFRLIELFDTVKNTFIPITHKFNNLFFSILRDEFSFAEILSNKSIIELLNERKVLLQENRTLDLVIKDKQNICEELKWNKDEAELNRDSYKVHYDFALTQKPEEPSIVLAIFTLGFCHLYYPSYFEIWEKAFIPIEKEFNKLEKDLDRHFNLYQKVTIQLQEDTNRCKSIKERLKLIDTEVKDILSKIDKRGLFDSKVELLSNLATTSRLVLETSIQKELLNPENFFESIETLGLSLQSTANFTLTSSVTISGENTENIFTHINSLVSRLESLPTINELIEDFSDAAVKQNKELDKEEISSLLHSLSSELELEKYSYGDLKMKFIDKVVENTIFDYNQVIGIVDSAKNYLQKMEEAYKIREEVRQLQEINHNNDTEIANQLMVLSSIVRRKVNTRKEKTADLLQNVSNDNNSVEEKLNTFNKFLK
ncbi:hypothetical protein ACYSNM_08300 [Myroides sp. LJL116]